MPLQTEKSSFVDFYQSYISRINAFLILPDGNKSFVPKPFYCAPFLFRLTIGLRNIDGDWRIVHEHHSVPSTEWRGLT